MDSDFLNFISNKKLFSTSDKILLAVSGGLDSMAMLHLFVKNNFTIAVAHCNFSLRGKESDADEKFVNQFCEQHKIKFYSQKFDTLTYAENKGISVQMAARDLRYEWFEKLRKEINYDYIATAHHKTDVAETMLINLLRGTGISGLHGISDKKKKKIRPLLFAARKEIEAFVKKEKIKFREDSSNASNDYVRNQIRHFVLPQLGKINPNFENSFAETAARIKDAEVVFQHAIEKAKKKIEQQSITETRYSIKDLKKLESLSIYLFEFLKAYNFTASVVDEIEKSLDKETGKIFLSSTHKLLKDRNFIIVSELEKQKQKNSFTINKSQKKIEKPISLSFKKIKRTPNFKLQTVKNITQLDEGKISFPLTLRNWKQGDSFQPLGMKSTKKLSDFFIDNKLSIFDKENVWLLCSGNEIVWIVNHRMDDRFKITSSTKNILQLTYKA